MGAVKALFRLQDVYNFSAATLAQGNLPGVDRHSIMTGKLGLKLFKIIFITDLFN